MVVDVDKLKILLVEDNPHALRLVRMVLRDLGIHQIFTAKDGREALNFLGECDDLVNMVISDWNMPNMSGLELLRQIRATGQETPFLMLTARATSESVEAAREAGVTAYIAKPFSPEQLERKILALASKVH